MTNCTIGVTLSEPPRRNGGESNGSLPRRARIVCSQRCQTNCIKLSQDFAKDFSACLRSVEMTQGGYAPIRRRLRRARFTPCKQSKAARAFEGSLFYFVNISIEIPRKARDDTEQLLCHPERSGGVAAAKSNGSEQFLTIAVCSLCCTIAVYGFQHIRLRSLGCARDDR